MTKKQMIQIIQQQEAVAFFQQQEARAFLKLKEATRDFGANHPDTNARRSEWCALDDLMQAAGIKPDNTLPEQYAAVAIMKELQSNPNI